MLTKRTHIVAVLVVLLAFPAVALAAGGDRGSAGGEVEAAPIAGPRLLAGERFAQIVHTVAHRIRVTERKRRRERFSHLPGGVSPATLDAIAACESGGDPTAVSADGAYRGMYQFDYRTWESVGGHGDPAAASEEEQDYRAALLYSESGSSPWPVCG